jgi:hypothetical protein
MIVIRIDYVSKSYPMYGKILAGLKSGPSVFPRLSELSRTDS